MALACDFFMVVGVGLIILEDRKEFLFELTPIVKDDFVWARIMS